DDRQKALAGLGKLENRSGPHVLLETVRGLDEQAGDQDEGVVFDLIRIGTDRGAGELVGMRADLEKLATSAKRPVTRQLGFVALIAADGNAEKAWALGTKSLTALQDLVSAMPLVRDPSQRASIYPKVEPLLSGLPKGLKAGSKEEAAVR